MANEEQIGRMLADAFGVPVPAPFVRLVSMAYRAADRDDYFDEFFFETFFDVIFEFSAAVTSLAEDKRRPPASGYLLTPPELLEFGGPGMDGIHYGFVVHAPELGLTDYPLGELQPIGGDGQGVYRLGDDTRSGLEFLMSRVLYEWAEEADAEADPDVSFRRGKARSDIEAIAEELGVAPSAAKGIRPADHITPVVPTGWRHVRSSDGIGVLAPATAFAPGGQVASGRHESIEPAIDDARTMIESGYPATALLNIRETFWINKCQSGAFAALKDVWARAYVALERPVLANALDWERR